MIIFLRYLELFGPSTTFLKWVVFEVKLILAVNYNHLLFPLQIYFKILKNVSAKFIEFCLSEDK